MSTNKKQVVEIVSVLAVVLSLLFFAFELRQSNQIAQLNARAEIASFYLNLNMSIFTNQETAELLFKLQDPAFEADDAESIQLASFVGIINNSMVTAENAYINGLYTEIDFVETLEAMRGYVIEYPGLHPYLLKWIDKYPSQTNFYEVWRVAKEELEIWEQPGM